MSELRQVRTRWLWFSWGAEHRLVVWFHIAGHKPLAHLPRWKRHLLHLPSVRWRLWPRPWNFNGPMVGYRKELRHSRDARMELWRTYGELLVQLPENQRSGWYERGTETFR